MKIAFNNSTYTSNKKKAIGVLSVIMFCLFVSAIRAAFSVRYGAAHIYGDELLHYKLGESLFMNNKLLIRGLNMYSNSFLYSAIISIVNCFEDKTTILTYTRIFNSIMMCSGLIPVYYLAEGIFKRNKTAWAVTILISLLPEFSYSGYFLQENVQFPIMMCVFYTVYQSEKKKILSYKYIILLAILSMACYWGKSIGTVLFIVFPCYYFILWLIRRKDKIYLKAIIIHIAIIGIFTKITSIVSDALHIPIVNLINTTRGVSVAWSSVFTTKMIYPVLMFFITLFLVCGLVAYFFPWIHFMQLEKTEQNLLIMNTLFVCLTIGVVWCLIIPYENHDNGIRVHMRYLFYAVPIAIILFYRSVMLPMNKTKKIFLLITSGCFIALLCGCDLWNSSQSLIDGCSSIFLVKNAIQDYFHIQKYNLNANEYYNYFIIYGLSFFVLINLLFALLKKQRAILISVSMFYVIIFVWSGMVQYKLMERNKQRINEQDLVTINDYLNDTTQQDENVVIIANSVMGMVPLEVYLQNDYYLILTDTLWDNTEGNGNVNLDEVVCKGFTKETALVNLNKIDYIIQKIGYIDYYGFESVLRTNDYEVLKNTSDGGDINIRGHEEGLTSDKWISDDEVVLTFFTKVDKLELRLDLIPICKGIQLEITTNNGEENIITIDSEGQYELNLERRNSDELFEVKIRALNAPKGIDINPESDDSRTLGARLMYYSIVERED